MARSLSDFDRKTIYRGLALVVILALLAPTLTSGAFHGPRPASPQAGVDADTSGRLFVIAAQGDELANGDDSRIVIVENESQQAIWETTTYPTYFDVDPLDESTLLYSVKEADGTTYAVVHDWRADEVLDRFEIAEGSHDVDYLGDGEYVYTDGIDHRVVVVNRTTGETVWTYDFTEHFPPEAGGGNPEDYSGDYTHLNDVDAVRNGSAFLVSPRNFDRVMSINRSTKEVEWTLGAENDYDVLYKQHNPELLPESPPTVLVADSENDRAVEYRKDGDDWRMVWEYDRNLEWPRDADRLPNGNTLIVDSRAAMEVTPSREVVWRTQVPKFLYDIEVIDLGDEPGGPSMVEYREEFGTASHDADAADASILVQTFDQAYETAQWVLPWWVSKFDLATAALGVVALFVWASFELSGVVRWPRRRPGSGPTRVDLAVVGIGVLLGQVALVASVASGVTFDGQLGVDWEYWNPFYHAVGILTLLEGSTLLLGMDRIAFDDRVEYVLERANLALAIGLVVPGTALFALGVGFRPDTVQISSPAQVFAVAAASLILGGRRLAGRAGPRVERVRRSPVARAGGGVAVVGVAIAILVAGVLALDQAGGFLGLGLLLAFVGGQWVRAAASWAAARGHALRSSAILGSWYALRLAVVVLAVGVVLRMLGLGTIGSLTFGPELLDPMYVALLVVALETGLGPLGAVPGLEPETSDPTARSPTGRYRG